MLSRFAVRSALPMAAVLLLAGCNSQGRTEEMIQSRLDAEKLKQATTEVVDLKKANEELRDENKALTTELLAVKATAQAATRVATSKTVVKATATKEKGSPAEVQEAREQLTGGGSFK